MLIVYLNVSLYLYELMFSNQILSLLERDLSMQMSMAVETLFPITISIQYIYAMFDHPGHTVHALILPHTLC